MSICSGFVRTVIYSNVSLFKSLKNGNFKTIPFRLLFSKSKNIKSVNREVDKSDIKLTGMDDSRFFELYAKSWKDLRVQKEGFLKICQEFKILYEEAVEAVKERNKIPINDREGRIDMLYTFETPEDLKRFRITTDQDFNSGYSSASLTLTDHGTGLFSGTLSQEPPKSEAITRPGFANMNSVIQYGAFYRIKKLDLSEYSHLVFKVRGDGRIYFILLHLPYEFTETGYLIYKYPLYTRGGPYWQIAKLPLHYFFLTKEGKMFTQDDYMPLAFLTRFGITVTLTEGPFKLEIDYIGLEYKRTHKAVTPYEEYHIK